MTCEGWQGVARDSNALLNASRTVQQELNRKGHRNPDPAVLIHAPQLVYSR